MRSLALFLVIGCAAAPLAAQNPQAPGRPDSAPRRGQPMMGQHMMGMMHGPMMEHGMGGPMMFAPQYLLERREQLALSAQQVTRLEALRDAARPAHDKAATAARAAGDSLHTALAAASPDTALVSRLFRAHHQAMGAAHWSMLSTGMQAKAVLTDVQRARVAGWADTMHHGPH